MEWIPYPWRWGINTLYLIGSAGSITSPAESVVSPIRESCPSVSLIIRSPSWATGCDPPGVLEMTLPTWRKGTQLCRTGVTSARHVARAKHACAVKRRVQSCPRMPPARYNPPGGRVGSPRSYLGSQGRGMRAQYAPPLLWPGSHAEGVRPISDAKRAQQVAPSRGKKGEVRLDILSASKKSTC